MIVVMGMVHLHTHTQFSLLDGLCKIDDLIPHVKSLGQTAVAMTDHGNVAGYLKFTAACQKHGIKPIVGVEQYTCADHTDRKHRRNHHLILLARNETGFRNLVRLNSLSHLQGYYYYPRVDLELLRRHREGLIVLSGCLGGEIAEDLRGGGYERALETARRYKAAVEPGSYFLEVQPNGLRDQIELNAALAKIGHTLDIPRVVTCDCHYLKKVHARAQDTLMAIQTRSNKEDKERLTHGEMHSLYLWTEGELRAQGFGEEAENAGRVAAMVDANAVPKAKVMLPKRDGNVADLARRGLRAALDKGQLKAAPAADYHERLEYELSVIGKTGFEGYFLIVADFCDHARQVKIPVGPGRGSGAGSLVARCLGITGLDPLAHGLLFERFLNPERVSMPDFDIDFDDSRREEMIEYLRETYGRDAVGGIANYAGFHGKSAIRDVLKVNGVSHSEAVAMVKDAPGLDTDTAKAPSVKWLREHHPMTVSAAMLDEAEVLEGAFRSRGIHASGVVIAPGPLHEYAPACRGKGGEGIATQLDMGDAEKAGLVKFDILGLSTLTLLARCQEFTGVAWETEIPTDDHAVYQLIAKADTYGVFQLGSDGIRRMLRDLAPSELRHLDAAVALFRPGPLQGGMVKDFIERRHGRAPVEHLHPLLADVTADTYGVIVYQEQVMAAVRALAGYSLGEADVVRRIMGKKKKEEVEPAKAKFLERATIDAEDAAKIWDLLSKFSGYGFNRSHSCAYAHLAYYTAWYKTHHRAAFFAAVAGLEGAKGREELARCLHEARAAGLKVLPPGINTARATFTPVDRGAIRCGFAAVKGLGEATALKIVNAQPYRTPSDVAEAAGLSKTVLLSLAQAGAFDEVAPSRAQAMAAASLGATRGRTGDLFAPRSLYPDAAPLARLDMLRTEKEAVGVYLTGHPLDGTAPATPLCGITDEAADGDRVVIRVLVTEYEEKSTKGGKGYAILTVEDETGVGEIMAWPRAWGQAWKAIEAAHKADSGILLRVVLHSEESEDGDARWKMELEQAVDMAEPVAAAELVLQVGEDTDVAAVVAILRAHPGPLPVRLVLGDESAVLAVRVSRDVAGDRGLAGMGVRVIG